MHAQNSPNQEQSSTSFHGHHGEINGHQVEVHGRVMKRNLRPNQLPDPDADAVTPHPDPDMRADGWRVEWFFIILLFALCVGFMSKIGMI